MLLGNFYIRRRQRLVFTLGYLSLFSLIVFFSSRLVNYIGIFDRKSLLVIDLNRDTIPSRWKYGSAENFTNPPPSNDYLPIAFYNDTDILWSYSKAETIKNHTQLWNHIREVNEAHVIYNRDRYGDEPLLFIIIIQVSILLDAYLSGSNSRILCSHLPVHCVSKKTYHVHNRSTHLMYLIESLRKVRYIEKALVVFSHDFFSPETNRMIDAMRFVRFTQIFFPYSVQLFPDSYPGSQIKDCHNKGYYLLI
ncbi:unnamed protein product [Rodentolepis nana]|uniref:Nucleotid_trans domain-containing protein n=1 Tax=Rodentolepis nana TaxID=102285 RepID=A0A0R3T1I3_RODNA|nr:unnamed protein product [Rodentolepis nana]